MLENNYTYEVECNHNRTCVWVHCSDGSTVGRFGLMGVDLHNSIAAQLKGENQCRLCTHGRVTTSDWETFIKKSFEFWGVVVPENFFDFRLLILG